MKVLDSLQRASSVETFNSFSFALCAKIVSWIDLTPNIYFRINVLHICSLPLSLRKQPISLKKKWGEDRKEAVARPSGWGYLTHRREWSKGGWGQALDVEVQLRNQLRASLTLPKWASCLPRNSILSPVQERRLLLRPKEHLSTEDQNHMSKPMLSVGVS